MYYSCDYTNFHHTTTAAGDFDVYPAFLNLITSTLAAEAAVHPAVDNLATRWGIVDLPDPVVGLSTRELHIADNG